VSASTVYVRELIAWDLDEYAFRGSSEAFEGQVFEEAVTRAQKKRARREAHTEISALIEDDAQAAQTHLDRAALRADLHEEYRDLDWRVGIVDLRSLLAFQRRLIFSPEQQMTGVPRQHDWAQLLELALGSKRTTEHRVIRGSRVQDGMTDIRLESSNPDLGVRLTGSGCNGSLPLALYGGSPNFEVAELHGRWFLRDGYHRTYDLLRQGVHRMPAIVIHAHTIEELGATEPWFFNESQLFSDRPPRLTDFLDDEMTFCYRRPAMRKVIRIRIEESLEPYDQSGREEREEQ
jgi:hypothetical protein